MANNEEPIEQVSGKDRAKKILKFLFKIALSAAALYLVSRNTDLKTGLKRLQSGDPLFLILAVISFNVSKLISTGRIKFLLNELGHDISWKSNFVLYYQSAFYNMLLPGSVGGDGYKVYKLKKDYDQPIKNMLGTVLLDRVGGLVALAQITGMMLIFTSPLEYWWKIGGAVILIGGFPAFYLFIRWFFRDLIGGMWKVLGLSFVVQFFQITTALCVMLALGIDNHYWEYIVLFMVASAAAAIPFTFGGLGARELVFSHLGAAFLIDTDLGVSVGLGIFAVTMITSIFGTFFIFDWTKKSPLTK